jgi:mannosyltransferase
MTSPSGSSTAGHAAVAGDTAGAGAVTSTAEQPVNGQVNGAQAAVVAPQRPEASEPGQDDGAEREFEAGPGWMLCAPPVIALLVTLWHITTPSYWRDEAATVAAVSRPFGELIKMLGNVDAVHSLYYMMMWPIAHVFGTGEFMLRFPSAVAAAAGAAAVAGIGRRLISPWAGLLAGLVFAFLPVTSRYAQEARSYEMVVAMATIASYLLVRVLLAEPSRRRRWIIAYGAGIGLLGVLNIFGLLLVPAHAVTVALHIRRDRKSPAMRSLAIGWMLAVAVGVVMASPLLAYGWMQRAQIAWLSVNTSSSGLNTLFSLSGSYLVTTAAIAVVAVALVLGMDKSKQQRRASWPWRLTEVSLPWMVVPPFILFAASVVHPVYTSRYVLMCIPALALLVGAAAASFGRVTAVCAVVIVLAAGGTAQLAVRGPAGHYDDIKALDQIVASKAKPGDAVLYTNPNAESFGYAYKFGLGKLPNVGVQQPAIPSGTLAGQPATLAQVRAKLPHYKRVWIVEINSFNADPELVNLKGLPVGTIIDGLPFTYTAVWRENGDYLILFTRA